MNSFLIRLALRGSRGSLDRLLGIVAGIAIGTTLILLLLGVSAGIQRRDVRGAWLTNAQGRQMSSNGKVTLDKSTALIAHSQEHFGDATILRLDVAATPESRVVVPGTPRAPQPGEYLVSPALAHLLKITPRDELADRFGQTQAGVIDQNALGNPNTLAVVVGQETSWVRSRSNPQFIHGFDRRPSELAAIYQTVIIIGAIAMVLPVVVLISIVSQLGAAARNERFATLRLIGASSRQIGALAGMETAIVSAIGAIAGVLLAQAIRPAAASISLSGESFLPSDLALSSLAQLAIILGMTLVSTLAAVIGVLRLGVSPLGAARLIQERKPAAIRLAPLILGLGLIVLAMLVTNHGRANGGFGTPVTIVGFLCSAAGVLAAGPWLTYQASRILARRAESSAGLIAAKRILSAPAATFRAASGLVLAIFMVSFFFGLISAEDPGAILEKPGLLPKNGLAASITGIPYTSERVRRSVAELKKTRGVTSVSVAYRPSDQFLQKRGLPPTIDIVPCSGTAALGLPPCSNKSQYAGFSTDSYVFSSREAVTTITPIDIPSTEATVMKPLLIMVITDGARDSMERARTVMMRTAPSNIPPSTRSEIHGGGGKFIRELALLAYLGAFLSIVIAGCSLAVAAAIAMIDRKRVFGLLRLVGMPISDLRKVVAYEAATPLASVTIFSAGFGYAVSALLVSALTPNHSVTTPAPAYYAVIGVGLTFAAAVIGSTLQMIRKTTGVSSTRFE
jgi:hypothetical protein